MGEFSEKDLLKVYSVGKVQSFRAGEIMVTEWSGEPALYVIMEGTAEVLMPRRNGWYKLASLGPAGVFGELSFFDRLTRSARVVVLIECNVLKIDDHAFESLREIDTKLALNLVLDLGKMLSHRLRNMNDLVRTLVR
ncbi:MAG: cyclic nucleotide-binding domain-containing protein [Chloroflexi bacterium]|nr:cyclic nucleotide-binding domain-containing protein [Chloroflexota bacterium]